MTSPYTQLERLHNMQEYEKAVMQMEAAIEQADEGKFLIAQSSLEGACENLETILAEQALMREE